MDDYIRREEAKDYIDSQKGRPFIGCTIGEAMKIMLDEVPAAPVREVKRGMWIWDDEGYHCSECFFHAYGNTAECMDGTYRFCPSCGSDMRGEQDEAD